MDNSIELTRKIYSDVLDWYKTAEYKAQVLIGLIGTLIVFSSGFILGNPTDVQVIVSKFDDLIWGFLILTFIAMIFGLYAAFRCFWSRMRTGKVVEDPNADLTYTDDQMYFFGHHAGHEPNRLFQSLKAVDADKELKIYSSQIVALSRNVLKKHKWVNRGYVAVSFSILLLLITTILYMINLIK